MTTMKQHSAAALFELSREALQTSQQGLGEMLGVSRRTAQRYARGGVPGYYMADLATLVAPHDRVLAEELASRAGTTLVALGAIPAVTAPLVPHDGLVDAIVCAAAEAMDASPRAVRAGLAAAFARARGLGLPLDAVERVLRAPASAP
jgi:hypothetical protein